MKIDKASNLVIINSRQTKQLLFGNRTKKGEEMGQHLLDLRKVQPEDMINVSFHDTKEKKQIEASLVVMECQPGKTIMLMEYPKQDHRVVKIYLKKTRFDTTNLPCHLITGGKLVFWQISTTTEDGSASLLKEFEVECFYVTRNPFGVRQIEARYNLSDLTERGSIFSRLC
ncbi:hypothetical protein IT399_02105 [Candidatus Nomurabacteria bacterium]|nr:hypothetical protein [Candidatus Nomurabacteria bacterium]